MKVLKQNEYLNLNIGDGRKVNAGGIHQKKNKKGLKERWNRVKSWEKSDRKERYLFLFYSIFSWITFFCPDHFYLFWRLQKSHTRWTIALVFLYRVYANCVQKHITGKCISFQNKIKYLNSTFILRICTSYKLFRWSIKFLDFPQKTVLRQKKKGCIVFSGAAVLQFITEHVFFLFLFCRKKPNKVHQLIINKDILVLF